MPCKKCLKEPVFALISGEKLCRKCFNSYFERKIRKCIRQYGLIEKGDRIAVAISGGKDSSVLLSLLSGITRQMKNIEIFAILIDEGIRGYRPFTKKDAVNLCKKLGIKLYVYSFKKEFGMDLDRMVKKLKKGPCTICGIFRRYLLNKAARELRANKMAFGHNADDEAQSVVMNLFRSNNDAAARLGVVNGIKKDARFIPRIKPMYFMLEKEITAYAFINGISGKFVECPYAGSAYRGEIRNMLNDFELRHPGTKAGILSSFLETLPLLKENFMKEGGIGFCRKCGEPTSGEECMACRLLKELHS
ncbi:MAG: TIGR00269 family protein [Candidatus Nanoarchaeia archaeon]|nr:TIGR00269 family protein [Candidatus Nanoarchaeia archaeon]